MIFNYKSPESGKQEFHWESYLTAKEAHQRKTHIYYLQKNKLYDEIYSAVLDYKDQQAAMRAEQEIENAKIRYKSESGDPSCPYPRDADNTDKTYREFALEWLPYQASKMRYAPATYDNYHSSLITHILPFLGDSIMSKITARDIDSPLCCASHKGLYE